ncbi:MAG: FtsX-like permease family protein, partial [Thermoanaerobaculia bacterium]
LAGGGGVAGLGVDWAAVRLYRASGGLVSSFWVDVRLDPPTLAVVAGATLVTAFAAGVVPAWRAARLSPGRALEGARGGAGVRLGSLGRSLVVVQIALSCALLAGTGLMLRSVQNLYAHDFGDDPERIWTASVSPGGGGAGRSAVLRIYDELAGRVGSLPGVESVAFTSHLPTARTPAVSVEVEGEPRPPGGPSGGGQGRASAPEARLAVVGPGYFWTLGRPVHRGRDFTAADREGSERVALVNRTFAETVLGGRALGRRIRFAASGREPGEWRRVVGVVPDLFLDWDYYEERMGAGAPAGVYVPLGQGPLPGVTLLVRTREAGAPVAPEVRSALAAIAPDVPLLDPGTLADRIAAAAADHRRVRTLVAACAAAALGLAVLGLYGVLSFTVGERLRELGVRSALGARRQDLAALVARSAARQLAAGLAVGAVLAFGMGGLLEGLLFGVEPREPAAFLLAAAALGLAAGAACLGPVLRAARLEPARVLRAE